MIGIPIVSVCYVLVNVAFFAGLSRAEILSSEATGLVGEAKMAVLCVGSGFCCNLLF